MEQMIKTQSGDTTESQAWTSPTVSDRGSIAVPNNTMDLPGLTHFNRARRELEMAVSVDEVKQIRDKAEAMRVYARQAKYSLQMQNMCAEIKLRAERRLGEMLRKGEVSQAGHKNLLRDRTMLPRENTPSLADFGISKSQSSRWQIMSELSEEEFEQRVETVKDSNRELTSKEILMYSKAVRREREREEKRQMALLKMKQTGTEERIIVLHGDFRNVLDEECLVSNFVDLILTDPAYGEKYVQLWGDLARLASRVLKPGKLLVSYSGKYHLPQVMSLLGQHLEYVWTAALIFPGQADTIFPRRIKTYWKPVLLYSNGPYVPEEKLEWFKDRIDGDGRTKSNHDWEQGLGEALYLVEHFTFEGDLVVDPFLGSGTNGVASKRLHRRFIGCDVDERSVRMALQRISQDR